MKLLLVLIFFFRSFLIHAQDLPTPQMKEFSALVKNVRLNSELIAKGKKGEDKISVKVLSSLFSTPWEIKDVRAVVDFKRKEIEAIIKYTAALVKGEREEIISFWSDKDQVRVKEIFSNLDMFQQTRAYYIKNPGLTILGIIYQKKSSTILVKQNNMVIGMSIIKKDDKFLLTNNPSDDLELSIVEASFM